MNVFFFRPPSKILHDVVHVPAVVVTDSSSVRAPGSRVVFHVGKICLCASAEVRRVILELVRL